ncbi:hypothetical protein FB157_14115 [Streptomyces sp. BK340]|nr:hypothetical protein FB157_14115 [Streptomyces sp. BK340]
MLATAPPADLCDRVQPRQRLVPGEVLAQLQHQAVLLTEQRPRDLCRRRRPEHQVHGQPGRPRLGLLSLLRLVVLDGPAQNSRPSSLRRTVARLQAPAPDSTSGPPGTAPAAAWSPSPPAPATPTPWPSDRADGPRAPRSCAATARKTTGSRRTPCTGCCSTRWTGSRLPPGAYAGDRAARSGKCAQYPARLAPACSASVPPRVVEQCRRDLPAPECVQRGLDEPTAEAGVKVVDGCGHQRFRAPASTASWRTIPYPSRLTPSDDVRTGGSLCETCSYGAERSRPVGEPLPRVAAANTR